MTFRINYHADELRTAADFIWANNPYARNWATSADDVERKISEFIIDHGTKNLKKLETAIKLGRVVEGWDDFTGTGGFYVTFYEDSETDNEGNRVGPLAIRANVLVDSAVGVDSGIDSYRHWLIDN